MGCDIHVYLERKRNINGVEKWVNIDYFKKNPYYDGVDKYETELEHVPVYSGRNYGLFSVLADVRNYGDVTPISEPKGVPGDMSDVTRKEYEYWECDGHSHSYFTLKELLDFYNKNKTQKFRGMISKQQQLQLDMGILPNYWCQGTNQEGFEFREWEDDSELKSIIDPIKERVIDEFYIYDKDDRDLYEKIYEKADSIRIVFWFDN